MGFFKNTVYIAVKLISIIGIIICFAGIIGIWIVNGSITRGLSTGLAGVEMGFDFAMEGVGAFESELTDLQGRVKKINAEIVWTGDKVADSDLTRDFMQTITESRLENGIETAMEMIGQFRQTVALLNSAVDSANKLPFLSIPRLQLGELQEIDTDLTDVLTAVQEVNLPSARMTTDDRQKAAVFLSKRLSNFSRTIDQIQPVVDEFKVTAGKAQKALSAFKDDLALWVNLLSMVVSLLFCWLIFSQWCLYIHSRDRRLMGSRRVY